MRQVTFFDTTLRDGQQQAGVRFTVEQKLQVARQLACVGMGVVEAGFASASPEDFEAITLVASQVEGIIPCSLARTVPSDIECATRALEGSIITPRVHTFIATSDIHMKDKLNLSRDEVLERIVKSVTQARAYTDDVQFSAEDATRSDFAFLKLVVREAILSGARTINLPDTVGCAMPDDIKRMVRGMITEVPEMREYNVTLSVHCHDDLGCAVANTLAGVEAGARQVECTVNGIGERAGNTHYAPVAMALTTRSDFFGVGHDLATKEIGPTATMVSEITQKKIADNFPVVGQCAFAHASGIHADGAIKHSGAYQIMTPESVGWKGEPYPLSSQSGKAGLLHRLERLGYVVSDNQTPEIYARFQVVAATVPLVEDKDLHVLMQR